MPRAPSRPSRARIDSPSSRVRWGTPATTDSGRQLRGLVFRFRRRVAILICTLRSAWPRSLSRRYRSPRSRRRVKRSSPHSECVRRRRRCKSPCLRRPRRRSTCKSQAGSFSPVGLGPILRRRSPHPRRFAIRSSTWGRPWRLSLFRSEARLLYRLAFGSGVPHRFLEAFEVGRRFDQQRTDEEDRRAGNAKLFRLFLGPRQDGVDLASVGLQISLEPSRIRPCVCSDHADLVGADLARGRSKQRIVYGFVFALPVSRQGHSGGDNRPAAEDGPIFIDKSNPVIAGDQFL